MASVDLDRASRVFAGGVVAVDHLDLQVRDGELLVLVGPSGCGKTTTLRLIAGLEPLSSGEIRIAERSVGRVPPRDRDVAMVFQGHALYPHLTVRQNLAFGLEVRRGGWLRRLWRRSANGDGSAGETGDIASRVLAAAQSLGIEPLLERMPAELSGGERQRVALGRAIVRRPAVFLLDEPLSNLDALLRASLRSELKRLHQALAATMVYVTHDQAEAMSLGDRIAVLDRGRLQQVGEPMDVYRHPVNRFVAGFLGSPPMNLFEAVVAENGTGYGSPSVVLRGDGWTIEVDCSCVPRDISNGRVVWGVRPEDIRLNHAVRNPQPRAPSPEPPAPGPQTGCVCLSGRVSLVEPLGDTTILHLAPFPPNGADTASPAEGNRVLLLKTSDPGTAKAGDRVEAAFDAARLYWFDALTGRNLRGFEASKR